LSPAILVLVSACEVVPDVTTLENIDVVDDVPTPLESVALTAALSVCNDSRILYLNPATPLVQSVQVAIEKFALFGYNVVIDASGVPVYVDDNVPAGAQAQTYWRGHVCAYDGCTALNSYIKITNVLLAKDPAFLNISMQHEIGHLLSGFGACVHPYMGLTMVDGMHLLSGHVISNGNTNYANMQWTGDDLILLRSCL